VHHSLDRLSGLLATGATHLQTPAGGPSATTSATSSGDASSDDTSRIAPRVRPAAGESSASSSGAAASSPAALARPDSSLGVDAPPPPAPFQPLRTRPAPRSHSPPPAAHSSTAPQALERPPPPPATAVAPAGGTRAPAAFARARLDEVLGAIAARKTAIAREAAGSAKRAESAAQEATVLQVVGNGSRRPAGAQGSMQ